MFHCFTASSLDQIKVMQRRFITLNVHGGC